MLGLSRLPRIPFAERISVWGLNFSTAVHRWCWAKWMNRPVMMRYRCPINSFTVRVFSTCQNQPTPEGLAQVAECEVFHLSPEQYRLEGRPGRAVGLPP